MPHLLMYDFVVGNDRKYSLLNGDESAKGQPTFTLEGKS